MPGESEAALRLVLDRVHVLEESLERTAARLERVAQEIEEGPVVQELHRQIEELRSREVERERFIAEIQEQAAMQVAAIAAEPIARAGPARERRQARLVELERLARRRIR
jgi:cell division protein FtsB